VKAVHVTLSRPTLWFGEIARSGVFNVVTD
jgi:hypothetical protein